MEHIAARSRDGVGVASSGSYVHEEAHPGHPHHPHASKSRAAMLWGVGSTILSVLGFLAWGLFEQYNSSLAELRADLKHFNEVSSTFVKKDSLTRFREQYKTQHAELQAMSASNKHLEVELKASERAREDMTRELIRFRERLAFVEGRQSASPGNSATRELPTEVKSDDHPPLAHSPMSREE